MSTEGKPLKGKEQQRTQGTSRKRGQLEHINNAKLLRTRTKSNLQTTGSKKEQERKEQRKRITPQQQEDTRRSQNKTRAYGRANRESKLAVACVSLTGQTTGWPSRLHGRRKPPDGHRRDNYKPSEFKKKIQAARC